MAGLSNILSIEGAEGSTPCTFVRTKPSTTPFNDMNSDLFEVYAIVEGFRGQNDVTVFSSSDGIKVASFLANNEKGARAVPIRRH